MTTEKKQFHTDIETPDIFASIPESQNVDTVEIYGADEILSSLEARMPDYSKGVILNSIARMLHLAYSNNKILSLSNSRTGILAHQVESTYVVINALNHRYILADEVGLGKTVEAGLVIKELIYRYSYRRIMVAAPASLLVQWQHELEEKFCEHFDICDRKYLDRVRREHPGENPWSRMEKIICSLDFIKNEKFREELAASEWDGVIFDEAHRIRRDAQSGTILYDAAEIISGRTKSLLLLTATPFRGKLEELFFLVRLVDKNLFGPYNSFYEEFCTPDADLSILRKKLSSVLLRRTKREIGGFTKRHARTIRFELYPDERLLYDETTRYVAEEFNRAMQTENRAVGFIMTVFQKLLDSSSCALRSALVNRKKTLLHVLERTQAVVSASDLFDAEDLEAILDEEENFADADSVQKSVDELREEISTIDRLIALAQEIKKDKKGEKLRKMIEGLKRDGYKKFLIFTQFRTTQDYLKELLKIYKVEVFNGSMDKDSKERAIENFKNEYEILICTEAGGEGRNMQFCNVLFNYDLPWSPLKIEQRIGRLHRFGQKCDVYIYNFSTKDTVAERVLDVLSHKLHLFEESIGQPDVMLGQIEDELSLPSLFMSMRTRKSRDHDREIEEAFVRARSSYEKLSALTVATRMDFNYDEYYRITQKERLFSNEQLEQFMLLYSSVYGGPFTGKKGSKKMCYLLEGDNRQGTFDSETALKDQSVEFLAFGHPVVDAAIHCSLLNNDVRCSSAQIKGDVSGEGILFCFTVTYRTAEIISEFLPVYAPLSGGGESDIEDRFFISCLFGRCSEGGDVVRLERLRSAAGYLYEKAFTRLIRKIDDRKNDILENLELKIDPEIDKINESFRKQTLELNDKIARYELQMKNEGKDMRSSITRARNSITAAEIEKRHLLARYSRYKGIEHSIDLHACILLLINRE